MKFTKGMITFFLFLFFPTIVFAVSSAEIYLEGVNEVKLGEEFYLNVGVRNISESNLMSVGGDILVENTDCLSFVRLEKVGADANNNRFVYLDMDGTQEDFVFVRAIFQAKNQMCSTSVRIEGLNYMFTDFSTVSSPVISKNISVANHLEQVTLSTSLNINDKKEVVVSKQDAMQNPISFQSVIDSNVTDQVTISFESSDTSVAVIDQTGLVTVKKEGVSKISVSATSQETGKTFTDSIFLNVVIPATGVTILDEPFSLYLGSTQSHKLNVAVSPIDTTENVLYSSSNSNIVQVLDDGTLFAQGIGEAVITVRLGNFSDTIKIAVKPNVTDILLDVKDGEEIVLIPTQTHTLVTRILPNNTNLKPTYRTTNESIASVNEFGMIEAKTPGETKVIVSCGDKSVERTVRVLTFVDDLVINIPKQTLNVNKKESITLRVQSVSHAEEEGTITWKSSDPDYVSVSQDGVIQALKASSGEKKQVVITATWVSNVDATHKKELTSMITIVAPIEDLILNTSKVLLSDENPTFSLKAQIFPSITSDDSTLNYVSSNPKVVQVVDGVLKAMDNGKAVVTVTTSNGISKTIEVEVNNFSKPILPFEQFSIQNKNQMNVGEKVPLKFSFSLSDLPKNVDIEYISSDESIVSVDESGNLFALKEGIVTITVRIQDMEATHQILVKNAVHPKTGLSSIQASMILVVLSLVGIGYSLFKKYQFI